MRKLIIPLALLAVLLVGGGIYAMQTMFRPNPPEKKGTYTVQRGALTVSVVETGNVDSMKTVEIKSRVSGRLAQLLVQEGDQVAEGQLIAVIDPKETQFRVDQDSAQLRGAAAAVRRSQLEIDQRRSTAAAALKQAEARVAQLEMELRTQPILSSTAVTSAEAALNVALREKERLVQSSQPTQRIAAQTNVDEAKATFEQAKSELDRRIALEKQGFVAGRDVDVQRVQVEVAKARLAQAQSNLDRLDEALTVEVAKAEEQIRQARADLARARANRVADAIKRKEYESAVADLGRARAQMNDPAILKEGMMQTQASVDQLQSVLSDSRRQLSETEIRSPIAGVVSKRLLEVGELATGLSGFSAGTPIVRIEDRSKMRMKLAMNEIDVAKLRVGMPARIDVDAIPARQFTGRISKIAPASDASVAAQPGQQATQDVVVRYQVELVLDQVDPELRTGMSGKVTVNVVNLQNVLLVPVDYVTKEDRNYYVWLPGDPKKPGAKPIRKQIRVGQGSGSQFEVLEGVAEGDQLVRPDYTGPARKTFIQVGGGGGDDDDQAKDKDKGKEKSEDK